MNVKKLKELLENVPDTMEVYIQQLNDEFSFHRQLLQKFKM